MTSNWKFIISPDYDIFNATCVVTFVHLSLLFHIELSWTHRQIDSASLDNITNQCLTGFGLIFNECKSYYLRHDLSAFMHWTRDKDRFTGRDSITLYLLFVGTWEGETHKAKNRFCRSSKERERKKEMLWMNQLWSKEVAIIVCEVVYSINRDSYDWLLERLSSSSIANRSWANQLDHVATTKIDEGR